MVRYSVLAICVQRTNDRRGSRQLTSFSLAMGGRGPNLLRAAVTGERPETLSSAKVSKWREVAQRVQLCHTATGRSALRLGGGFTLLPSM
jgi:hypothetical protein